MTKFIYEKSNVDLEKDKSLFEYADKVRMRIPTSCGRVGDCHECIVEIIEGENNLSEQTNDEQYLSSPFRLACQAKTIYVKDNLKFTPRKRDRKILTTFDNKNDYEIDNHYVFDKETIVTSFRLNTDTNRFAEEYLLSINSLLSLRDIDANDIDSCVICSVEPPLNPIFTLVSKKLFSVYH